jgi:hypothetical protein
MTLPSPAAPIKSFCILQGSGTFQKSASVAGDYLIIGLIPVNQVIHMYSTLQ